MIKKLLLTAALTLACYGTAQAQSANFYDSLGRSAGSATQQGNWTWFSDSLGRSAGSATQQGNWTRFSDSLGRSARTINVR